MIAEQAKSELDVLQSLTAVSTTSTAPKQRRPSMSETISAAFTRENLFHAAEKDFVKKIYRSEKALKEEQQRQQDIKSFVIHPFSNFRCKSQFSLLTTERQPLRFIPLDEVPLTR